MSRKKRILVNSEYSQNNSGYSRVAREILTRLHKSGKYEVAELACYCDPNDPSILDLPWQVFPVLPNQHNQEEINEYNSNPANPNGRHKFHHVVLDFLPDVILQYKDQWYDNFVHSSPLRRFYNVIWINPTDSLPLMPEWIDDAIDCDACFAYSDFGTEVLKRQCGNLGNIAGTFRLCADANLFHPIWNRGQVKDYFNYKKDSLIVGFVARNQYRKLFDEVLQSFAIFLEKAPKELTSRTHLYIHSGWPDFHIKFPQILSEYGIADKVLFTYYCKQCQNVSCSVYSDVTSVCRHCGGPASLPKPTDPIPENKLNLIYNFFDMYVANFTNEGVGLPALEAMFCGVPTAVTNFSGAEDLVNICGAIPLKFKLRREGELHRLFAVPDNADLVNKMTEILSLPNMIRKKIGFEQFLKARQNFSWDNELNKLMYVIDRLPEKDWGGPARIHKPNLNMPEDLQPEQYIWWLYNNVEGRPEAFNKYEGFKKVYQVTYGFTGDKPHFQIYNKQMALNEAIGNCEHKNYWETERVKRINNLRKK